VRESSQYDQAEDTPAAPAWDFRKKRPKNRLFADSKFLDDVFVAFGVVLL
jgi:hypothetical protein